MSTIKKRKRKKKYHTGFHTSPKGGIFKYRSQWEKDVAVYLDRDATVVSYGYEVLVIPYTSNLKTGKIRKYYPDFLVTYADGTKKLIEVKRQDKINDPKVMKKSNAARVWCKNNNVEFEIWSNTTIKTIKVLNQQQSKDMDHLTSVLTFPQPPQVFVF